MDGFEERFIEVLAEEKAKVMKHDPLLLNTIPSRDCHNPDCSPFHICSDCSVKGNKGTINFTTGTWERNLEVQEDISESLDSAIDNGYDDLLDWTDLEIAEDLGQYDKQFEDFDPQDLVPYVQAWRKARS